MSGTGRDDNVALQQPSRGHLRLVPARRATRSPGRVLLTRPLRALCEAAGKLDQVDLLGGTTTHRLEHLLAGVVARGVPLPDASCGGCVLCAVYTAWT